MLPVLCSLGSVWDSERHLLLFDTRIALHKIYGGGGKPPTIQQLCSCEFNLESNHMFPIKPVIALWGGDGGRGLVWFYAQFSFQETLFFPFGQITAAQYC